MTFNYLTSGSGDPRIANDDLTSLLLSKAQDVDAVEDEDDETPWSLPYIGRKVGGGVNHCENSQSAGNWLKHIMDTTPLHVKFCLNKSSF